MHSSGNETFKDYHRLANPPELENLRNALTINVTEFFRDNEVYECMRKDILPLLFSSGNNCVSGVPDVPR